jgi:NitT/TauT family transport system substrate-binding protein
MLAALAAGCGQQSRQGETLVLNWKAEPEFGGIYEAQRLGLFDKDGLNLELRGGPDAPVVQMVESGTATFGMASADEVVMARARGADLVAIFATYQTCPQGLMAHGQRDLKDIKQVFNPGGNTVAMELGLPYVKVLEAKYGFRRVQVVPYTYSNALWMNDPNMVQQCFVTSEPIAARRAGAKVQVFLIADTGYNPYTAVVIARGQTVRQQPAKIKALVAALRTGWAGYLRDPTPANEVMEKLNPSMDAYTFREAARVQMPLIQDAQTAAHGLGGMTAGRWQTLIDQLKQINVIEQAPKATDCFADVDALPGKP